MRSITTTTKWKTANGILETATPHRVSLCETILSRKGRGKGNDKDKAENGIHRFCAFSQNDKWLVIADLIRNLMRSVTTTATTKWKTAHIDSALPFRFASLHAE
jgi:hypothetical protein